MEGTYGVEKKNNVRRRSNCGKDSSYENEEGGDYEIV